MYRISSTVGRNHICFSCACPTPLQLFSDVEKGKCLTGKWIRILCRSQSELWRESCSSPARVSLMHNRVILSFELGELFLVCHFKYLMTECCLFYLYPLLCWVSVSFRFDLFPLPMLIFSLFCSFVL